MIANNRIKVEMKSELQMALIELKETDHENEVTPLLEELNNYDFEAYKTQLTSEIKKNIKEVWTNSKSGISKDQKLDAILFEYSTPHKVNLKASAHGIIDWKEKDTDGIEVDLGLDYKIVDGFKNLPGLTLSFFNPYVNYNTAHQLDEYYLAACFKLKGLIAVHEVFAELDDKKAFKSLTRNQEFCFLIGEQNTSSCQLLYSLSN